jgi:hypothetical protein
VFQFTALAVDSVGRPDSKKHPNSSYGVTIASDSHIANLEMPS